MNTNSMQTWQPLEEIGRDLAYGWRIFAQSAGFTAIVVLTLALGIGANTAIFSIVHAVLLRPLPFENPSQLVAVWDSPLPARASRLYDVYGDWQAYHQLSQSFTEVAGETWAVSPEIMSGRGAARDVFAIPVTANFFDVLGVKAARGRTFTAPDEGRGCALVLSDHFWKNVLGAQASILGGSLRLNDQSCDVLGVMPADFAFIPEQADAWTLVTSTSAFVREPNRHSMGIFARLKPGITRAAALAELKVLHKRAHVADKHARGSEPQVFPLEEEFTSLSGRNLRLSLLVLFAAVLAVLLISCVNVANLLLGRSLRREKELAVRAALGSGRARLMRQLLTENLAISLSAAVIGCGLAFGAIHYFRALNPVALPPGKPVEVNLAVLAFTAGLSVVTTVIFGFFPAWKGSQANFNHVLKASGRGTSMSLSKQRVGQGLVVFEVMLSLVLLVAAGLLIRSVIQYSSAPLGFAKEGVVSMSVSLPPGSYATPARRASFYDRVLDRLAEMTEVQAAALTTSIPSIGGSGSGALSTEGRPEPENAPNDTREQFVSRGYFQLFQVPLLRGRAFSATDRQGSEDVALVNEALVHEYFPHEDPVGKHMRFRGLAKTESLVVIGVVANEKHFSRVQEMSWVSSPLIYRPLAQDPPADVHVVVRGPGDASRTGEIVQRRLAELDPTVPVFDVETLSHFLTQFTGYPEFRAVVLGGFAALALVLAVVGLYGVLSQLVEQRTQEIGVRVALGAQQGDVVTLVMRGGLLLTMAGIGLGLFAAWALTRFLSSLLYGVGSTDLLTFGAVSLLLAAAALAAMYLPARRAARVDPIKALRYE